MIEKTVLVFYDSKCVLCDRSIIWLIKNDLNNVLRFAHVSGPIAQKQAFTVSTEAISVITPSGEYYKSSQAVLYLLLKIKRYKPFYSFLKLFPVKLLNFFYRKIAANRYRWFGQYSECKIPDESIKSRFLDFYKY